MYPQFGGVELPESCDVDAVGVQLLELDLVCPRFSGHLTTAAGQITQLVTATPELA